MSTLHSPARLSDLAHEHEEIRARLLICLDAIALGDAASSRGALARCTELLLAHAAAEDEHLIPLFVARGLETSGCTAEILGNDHRKLRKLLADLRALVPEPGEALPARQRVELVLGARGLLELLAHHDQRERTAFFPALDAALTPEERSALYALCARSQAKA